MDLNLNKLAALRLWSWYFDKKSRKFRDATSLSRPDEDLKMRRKQYGICLKCGQTLTNHKYCQTCSSNEFRSKFDQWTSENQHIDEFIRRSQLNATNNQSYLLWIPFDDLINVKYIANGGFTSVYSAHWDRHETGQMIEVVFKRLHNGQISNPEFLREQVSTFLYGAVNNSNIIRCYGFTKHPTEGYMLVLEYAQGGDLRSFFRQESSNLLWLDKLSMIKEVSKSLELLHNHEIIHSDLHTGNILKRSRNLPSRVHKKKCKSTQYNGEIILDIPLNFDSDILNTSAPYGVIPYVGPEVFEKGYYTKQSDIYSLGIVIWEISTNESPFFDYNDNKKLVDDIIKGVRPKIEEQEIPKCVVDLMQKCWDPMTLNRPSAKEVISIIDKWIYILSAPKIRLSSESKKILNQFSLANNTTKEKVKRHSRLPSTLSRSNTLLRNNNYYSKSLSKYLIRSDVEKSANASSFSLTDSVDTIIQQDDNYPYDAPKRVF